MYYMLVVSNSLPCGSAHLHIQFWCEIGRTIIRLTSIIFINSATDLLSALACDRTNGVMPYLSSITVPFFLIPPFLVTPLCLEILLPRSPLEVRWISYLSFEFSDP